MKKTIFIIVAVVWAMAAKPQAIYNNAAHIVSDVGSYWVVNGGNFTLTSQGNNLFSMDNLIVTNSASLNISPSSYLTISNALQNNGTFTGATTSTVTLNGATTQNIGGSGTTTFGNLSLNNSAGFSLTNNVGVNGTLNFQNGLLTTGLNTLTIGVAGNITNANATKYINGKLGLTFNAIGSKNFPIGKGGNYRPLTFQYTSLTGTSVVTAEQFESGLSGTLPVNTELLTTNRSWTISQTGGSNLQYFVTLDTTDYTPTLPVLMLKQDAGTIASYPTTNPNYTNVLAFSTFSNFGLGIECANPTNGGTIASDQNICGSSIPAQITSTALPTGQIGNIIYKWQMSTTSSSSGFSDITNSNSASYSPAAITQTTRYKRLAIVDCSPDWTGAAESNVITLTLSPLPAPIITGSPNNFYNVPKGVTYQYSTPLVAGDLYSWSAPGSISYCSATAINCISIPFVDPCGTYGQWTINVTETNPTTGCSATATKLIYINP